MKYTVQWLPQRIFKFLGLAILITSALPATPQSIREHILASGSFQPGGTPISRQLKELGDLCVVDIEQRYVIDGTIIGTLLIDYRILIQGPCGTPPGTYEEQWIAYGSYEGEIAGDKVTGSLLYLAQVEAGGEIAGVVTLTGLVAGDLNVSGSFDEGKLSYVGKLAWQ